VGLLASPAARHPAGSVEPVEDARALGRLGSGLAGSFLSPLAAALLAAALARGELVEPHWIARVRDVAGELVAVPEVAAPRRIWEPGVADALRRSLRGVTERGTARRAFRNERDEPLLGDVTVAGKTGTLRGDDPKGLYQWFVGVAPADEPRIAIAALVVHDLEPSEQRGGAGANASHVAAETLRSSATARLRRQRVELFYARQRAARRVDGGARLQRAARERARTLPNAPPARLLEASDIELPRRCGAARSRGDRLHPTRAER
jgi:membrane peptidoglycan carboxypeptidase